MAINIYTEPDNLQSPYRPYYFDCSSDLGTIQRMIADVYIGSSLVSTIDVDPIIGTTDQFRFEVGEIIQKNLTSEFDEVSALPETFDQTTSATDVYLNIFEVYTSGSLLDTSWSEGGAGTGYATSTVLNVSNLVFQHSQKDDASDYLLTSSSGKFGTNRPQNIAVSKNQYFFLGGVTSDSAKKIQVVEYDGLNGTGSTVNSSTSGTVAPTYQSLNFGIDTSDLDSTTKSFSFKVQDGGNSTMSETFYVNLDDSCDNEVIFYWQNNYGKFDTHVFKGRYSEKTRTKTSTIERRLAKDYNFSDRGLTDLTKENERVFEVYTKLYSRTTIEWLAEIGESVDVRIQETINGAKEIIPVNVKNISSKIVDTENGVYQLKVEYVLSNQRINLIG